MLFNICWAAPSPRRTPSSCHKKKNSQNSAEDMPTRVLRWTKRRCWERKGGEAECFEKGERSAVALSSGLAERGWRASHQTGRTTTRKQPEKQPTPSSTGGTYSG